MALSPELDYRVEELLFEWWPWENNYSPAPRPTISSIYLTTRNRSGYDSSEQLIGENTNHQKLDAIGASVGSLPRAHREAIDIHMLNATTAAVWRSNRLGANAELLYIEAKELLVPMLRKRHVEI